MYDLSIIIPTFNRGHLLERCLAAIDDHTKCTTQLIVVDGGSTDSTSAVLTEAAFDLGQRLVVIREEQREGFVKAANKGFAAATGKYAMWLNDDARPLPGALDQAVWQLEAAPNDVGILALFHRFSGARNVAFESQFDGRIYRLLHVRGTLYANFGIARRDTFTRLGYFDERYYVNGADPDFSLKCWQAGLTVVPAYGCMIDHDEHADERRAGDVDRARLDNDKLFAKWILPDRNPVRNDFDPARPCTLKGLRADINEAA